MLILTVAFMLYDVILCVWLYVFGCDYSQYTDILQGEEEASSPLLHLLLFLIVYSRVFHIRSSTIWICSIFLTVDATQILKFITENNNTFLTKSIVFIVAWN